MLQKKWKPGCLVTLQTYSVVEILTAWKNDLHLAYIYILTIF